MATATEEARRQVIEAREALGVELDEFTSAARSAVNIPAKIMKNPLQTTALAAGAGFLVVGGPKRVLKAVGSRIRPPRQRRPHEGLLPKEIDKAVKKKAGPYAPEIEEALEDDFAHYLEKKGELKKQAPTPAQSLLKTYDAFLAPLGVVVAKQLTERLFGADKERPRSGQEGAAGEAPSRSRRDAAAPSDVFEAARGGRLSGLGDAIRRRTSKGG